MSNCGCGPNTPSPTSRLTRNGRLGTIGILGALTTLHLPCLVTALGSSIGLGGLAIWCGHQSSEANQDFGIQLNREKSLPPQESRHPYSQDTNKAALQTLLTLQPTFKDAIAAKTKDANGAPVDTVFFKDDQQNIFVVVCLNGMMCPCSEPQAYRIGKAADLKSPEQFQGQHALLQLLADKK